MEDAPKLIVGAYVKTFPGFPGFGAPGMQLLVKFGTGDSGTAEDPSGGFLPAQSGLPYLAIDSHSVSRCCCPNCPTGYGYDSDRAEPCYDPHDEEGCPDPSDTTYGWKSEAELDEYMENLPGGPFPGEGIPSCDANPAECGCYYSRCDPSRPLETMWGYYICMSD